MKTYLALMQGKNLFLFSLWLNRLNKKSFGKAAGKWFINKDQAIRF